MATVVTDVDGAVIATFTAADDSALVASRVRMGPLVGGIAVAQIAVNAETVTGSNDGTNFDIVATAGAANDVVTISPVPLFLSVPAANTGGAIVVGWRNR